ncbi:MAG: hypothetical protein CL559_02610 [Alphaproteobacteria bacterium]|nr:hypothetical protein [Alphaproteobacteria bacterium]
MRLLLALIFILIGFGWFYYANNPMGSANVNGEALERLGTTPLVGALSDDHAAAGDWGDIRLNQTQFARFIEDYGYESTIIGMGELTVGLHNKQVELTFVAVGGCQRQMQFMSMRNIFASLMQDKGQTFFGNAPACREEMPLREITIRSESLLSSRFLKAPVYIPQVSVDKAIEPEDKVFDVVRKFGLPPSAGTGDVPNSIGGFTEFSTLNYPGVTVYYQGDFEFVQQWYRYAGALTTASDLVNGASQPVDANGEPADISRLKGAVLELLRDPDLQAGAKAISDLEDTLSPSIAMIRLQGKPSPAMLAAYRNSPY